MFIIPSRSCAAAAMWAQAANYCKGELVLETGAKESLLCFCLAFACALVLG